MPLGQLRRSRPLSAGSYEPQPYRAAILPLRTRCPARFLQPRLLYRNLDQATAAQLQSSGLNLRETETLEQPGRRWPNVSFFPKIFDSCRLGVNRDGEWAYLQEVYGRAIQISETWPFQSGFSPEFDRFRGLASRLPKHATRVMAGQSKTNRCQSPASPKKSCVVWTLSVRR